MKYLITFFLVFVFCFTIKAEDNYASQSVLATGNWIKVAASQQGVHKITYNQLIQWGINNPGNVAIYSNGGYMIPVMNSDPYPDDLTKLPVLHAKDNENNDAVFFYSTGSTKWNFNHSTRLFEHTQHLFDNKTYFYIKSDNNKSNAPETISNSGNVASETYNTFNDFQVYHNNNINIVNSGNIWYSDRIIPNNTKTLQFEFPHFSTSKKGTITVSAAVASSSSSLLEVNLNKRLIDEIEYKKKERASTTPNRKNIEFNPESKLEFGLTYKISAQTGDLWLEYLTVNIMSKLVHNDHQLIFRNIETLNNETVAYNIESSALLPAIWDISNPLDPKNISFTKTNNTISFTEDGNKSSLNEYIIFDIKNSNIPSPSYVENVQNQNIHGLPQYDMIIVSHPDFLEPSETLAEYHRQTDNMKVLILETNIIYNEFSSGIPDAGAIRNMAKMFYDRGNTQDTRFRYLLLMGGGSYNNHLHNGTKNNFIPTYQSGVIGGGTTYSFMSDDFFAILGDDDGALDGDLSIGVGRIPCNTIEDARIAVEKNLKYHSEDALGDWRNAITFLADDGDNNLHMRQTETAISIINENYKGFIVDKIYFDAYPISRTSGGDFYPDVNKALNHRIEEGTLIFNYIGHANATAVSDERVLMISDVKSWGNKNKYPVFVTATCKFSPFDDDSKSIGEEVLFHPSGGAVALFSTTRDVYPDANSKLANNFYRHVFQQDEHGENLRLGDIMRLAKNSTADVSYNKRSFTLLGNPALKFAFPKHKVVTTAINGKEIGDSITISALDKVTIEGMVTDHNGNILENYNGNITSFVYDKELNVQTLGNIPGSEKFNFNVRDNVIFKGLSTVKNGKFSFSFITPKDILYNTDTGKIFYYTSNDEVDGNGSTEEFYIGGSSENPVVDNNPPQIEIFFNSDKFRSGDKISSSAILMVRLQDESGINTVGTGIGHDIVAVLNDDHSNPIVLNNYYSSHPNTYQQGTVLYPMNNLEPGEHFISVKAWDVLNNSSTTRVSFFVEDGFEIISVKNTPNPVQFFTEFKAIHNLPGDVFNIEAEIFNLRGNRVAHVKDIVGSYGTTEVGIRWDIADTSYPLGNESILIYRVTLTNQEGIAASGSGKLLMNKY